MRKIFGLIALAMIFVLTGCDIATVVGNPKKRNRPMGVVEQPEAEPDQLNLPIDGAWRAWSVGAAPYERSGRSASLGTYLNEKGTRVWGAAIAPSAATAIVTYMRRSKSRKDYPTRALLCDLRRGQVVADWDVADMLAPFAIHPDGTHALMCRQDGVLSQRETLYLVDLQSQHPEMIRWQPLVDPSQQNPKPYCKQFEIKWAEFVGDRIVTLNNAGQIHIWNLWDLERVGMIPDVVGTPCLTPDGSQVAFLTDDMAALFDPQELRVLATQRIGEFPESPVLSFDPDGRRLAIGGRGKLVVLDLDSREIKQSMITRLETRGGMDLTPNLAWMGDFIFNSRQLYCFDSPIPIWRISGATWEQPVGRSLWAIVRTRNSRMKDYVLRSFELPVMKIERDVEKAFQSSDIVALRPGDPVRIDVAGIPKEHRDKVSLALQGQLERAGFKVAARASVSLVASIDPSVKTCNVKYHEGMWGGPGKAVYEFKYDRRPAQLDFVKRGKSLWNVSKSIQPPNTLRKLPEDGFLYDCGGPDYDLYANYPLPRYLRGTKGSSVIGTSHLFADGIR